jgi:hypothetical protein
MKVRRWRKKTNNREKWESVVKEANVFRGLWSKSNAGSKAGHEIV